MKEVFAIIRMDMIGRTKKALSDAGIISMNAHACLGRGKGLVDLSLLQGAERGYEEAITQLGQRGKLIPKRILNIVLPDDKMKKAVRTIIDINQTGKSGDGKIFVMAASDSVRIRTGESGELALDEA